MGLSNAQIQKRLKDPGSRSKLSNAQLKAASPALYAKRVQNQKVASNNKTYDPMALLTGNQIYSLATKQAGQQYDPQINQATTDRKTAIANDAALAERIAGINKFSAGALADAHEQAQTGAGVLTDKITKANSDTLGALDASNAQSQQFVKDDEALRGADVTGGMAARLASDFQTQRASTVANQGAQANTANAVGQGWAGLMGMMQGAAAMQGQDNATQSANMSANREFGLQQGITDLKAQKAAAVPTNVNTLRSSEFEKGAAIQTLGIKQDANKISAAKAVNDAANHETTYDKQVSTWAAKVGKTPHEFMLLGPKGRAQAIDQYNKKQRTSKSGGSQGKVYTTGPFSGYTDTDVAHMPQSVRNGKVDQYNKLIHPGKQASTQGVNGVKLRPAVSQSKFVTTVQHIKNGIVPDLKSGRGVENPSYDPKKAGSQQWIIPPKKGGYTRPEAAALLKKDPNAPEEIAITAALDAGYDGHLSQATVDALQAAGIKVSSLGVMTRNQLNKAKANQKKSKQLMSLPRLTKHPQ